YVVTFLIITIYFYILFFFKKKLNEYLQTAGEIRQAKTRTKAKKIYQLFAKDDGDAPELKLIVSNEQGQDDEKSNLQTLTVPSTKKSADSTADNEHDEWNINVTDSDNGSDDEKDNRQQEPSIINQSLTQGKMHLSFRNTSINNTNKSPHNLLRRDNSSGSLRSPLLAKKSRSMNSNNNNNNNNSNNSNSSNSNNSKKNQMNEVANASKGSVRFSNTKECIDMRAKEEDYIRLHKFDADIFQFVKDGNLKELKLLFRKGHDLNILDYDNRNLLHVACCGNNLNMVKWLVQNGVKINVRDSQLQTPLYEAKRIGNEEIITYLQHHGAVAISVLIGSKLCELGSKGDIQGLHTLLKEGRESLSVGDADFRTALHLAACEGHIECVKWLVANGANSKALDRFGHTPLDDAKRSNRDDICEFFEQLYFSLFFFGSNRQIFRFPEKFSSNSNELLFLQNFIIKKEAYLQTNEFFNIVKK
ncbi:hypothetical protein RFI_27818, partial [Reticulomyxa filosa]